MLIFQIINIRKSFTLSSCGNHYGNLNIRLKRRKTHGGALKQNKISAALAKALGAVQLDSTGTTIQCKKKIWRTTHCVTSGMRCVKVSRWIFDDLLTFVCFGDKLQSIQRII